MRFSPPVSLVSIAGRFYLGPFIVLSRLAWYRLASGMLVVALQAGRTDYLRITRPAKLDPDRIST
jgi:hypothetical protein